MVTVPDYQALMRPVLEILAGRGQLHVRRELVPAVSEQCDLSESDLAERITSGMPLIENRVHWAVTYLVQASAVTRPRRGYAEINRRGRELLAGGHDQITNRILDRFPEFVEFRQRTGKAKRAGN